MSNPDSSYIPMIPSQDDADGVMSPGVSVDGGSHLSVHRGGPTIEETVDLPADGSSSDQRRRVRADEQRTVISKQTPGSGSSSIAPISLSQIGESLEGRNLGHFRLEEFVGGGGMGAVFRATDTMLNRTVAVKVLSQDQSGDPETLRRFKNEAQSAARLDHENIARVHYVGEDDDWHFIVFEFIEGTNIRDVVAQDGPLPLDLAVSLVLQIAEALQHAAMRDVVHRDIKPSNILITPHKRAKLVDMGLARFHHVDAPQNDLTATGVTLGTFDYISPEQARDPRSADVRSDLYSLGCTFYYMLTGRPPFPEGTVLQKLLSHSSDAPPDPRQFRPQLPDEVSAIIAKMLAKQPEERYQEPSEVIGELLLLAERLGLAVASHGAAVWISTGDSRISPLERQLPWIVPVVLLLLIVFALSFFSSQTTNRNRFPRFEVDATAARGPTVDDRPDSSDTRSTGGSSALPIVGAVEDTEQAAGDDATGPATDVVPEPGVESEGEDTDPIPPPVDDSASDGIATAGGISAADETEGEIAAITPTDNAAGGIDVMSGVEDEPPAVVGPSAGSFENDAAGVLIVGEGSDLTLNEAIASAMISSDIEVIELRFSDRVNIDPFSLVNRDLTIRADQQHTPILVFHAGTDESPAKSMITVTGGELVLEDIHLELSANGSVEGDLALFELNDVEMVRLVNCTMTAANVAHEQEAERSTLAFFEIGSRNIALSEGDQQSPLAIDLWHCIARGEATLVRAEKMTPIRLSWTNGLFSTSERLLEAHGCAAAQPLGNHMEVYLDHVTAILERGLCLTTNTELAPHQLTLALRSYDSILVTSPEAPLIEQTGVATAEEFQEHIDFRGRGNFYPQTEVFWRIARSGELADAETMDFAAWLKKWGDDERLAKRLVKWQALPFFDVPHHQHTTADYAVMPHPSNPAYRAASDRTDAGFDAELLPKLPKPDSGVIDSSEETDTLP
jgi:serine/threonine protein kinase